MARKTAGSPTAPARTELLEPLAFARDQLEKQVALGNELRAIRVDGDPLQFETLKKNHRLWDDYNETLLSRLFSTDEVRTQYGWAGPTPEAYFEEPTLSQKLRREMEELDAQIAALESILARLDLFPTRGESSARATAATPASAGQDLSRAFVVHGHDVGTRDAVARLLRELGVEPIILFEQPSGGRTVIEKLEHYSNVGFAVVILTPDDEGSEKGAAARPRARQNVVLELGYFIGKLTRSRVCPLYKGDIELPSDYHGVVYIQLDDSGAWKYRLADELRVAGYPIDKNKIS